MHYIVQKMQCICRKNFLLIWNENIPKFGAPTEPHFFLFFYRRPKWGTPGAPIFYLSFTAAKGGGFPKVAPVAPLPRRVSEIPPKAGFLRVSFNKIRKKKFSVGRFVYVGYEPMYHLFQTIRYILYVYSKYYLAMLY